MAAIKQYTAIVKIDIDRFFKYRNISDLKRFTHFLDTKYSGWRYFNVYDKKTGEALASFTNKNKPTTKSI